MPKQNLEKTACTKPCGSSDGMQLYLNEDNSITGYCYVCQYFDPNPRKLAVNSNNTTVNGLNNNNTWQEPWSVSKSNFQAAPFADIKSRNLMDNIVLYYGVKSGNQGAEHWYPYYKEGELVAYKARNVTLKEFYSKGKIQDAELFGEHIARQSNSPKLIITEGEIDAMSAFQMLWLSNQNNAEYKNQIPAVVSINNGAGSSLKNLANSSDLFDRFKEIILCFDNDKAGKEAAEECKKIIPIEKLKVCTLPLKDANEMLKQNRIEEFKKEVLFKSKAPTLLSIVSREKAWELATKMPVRGYNWPFPTLSALTYGQRLGELYGVAAGVGIGKTTWWHCCCYNAIEQNLRPGMLMLEESPGKTYKNLATFFAKTRLNRPDGQFTQEELNTHINAVIDKVTVADHHHMALQDKSAIKEIESTIRYMALVEGCKYICIDPLSVLIAHVSASEGNELLNSLMVTLEGLCESLNIIINYGSHLNPPKYGPSHEQGGRVYEHQLTGSRGMIKSSHYILGLERNKHHTDPVSKNTTTVRVLKDREFGDATGQFFYIVYDSQSGLYKETSQAPLTLDGKDVNINLGKPKEIFIPPEVNTPNDIQQYSEYGKYNI